jgi:hypothetical protein
MAINLLAGRLRSMAPRSSAASTVASHVALWAATTAVLGL